MRSAMAKATLPRRKPRQRSPEAHERYEQQPTQTHRRREERTTNQLLVKDETSHRRTPIKQRERQLLHTSRACFKILLEQQKINIDSQGYVELEELIDAIKRFHKHNIPFEEGRALATSNKCFRIISDQGRYWIVDTAPHNVTAHSGHQDSSPELERAHSKVVDRYHRLRPQQSKSAPPPVRHATPPSCRQRSASRPTMHPPAICCAAPIGSAPVWPRQTQHTADDQAFPQHASGTQLSTTFPQSMRNGTPQPSRSMDPSKPPTTPWDSRSTAPIGSAPSHARQAPSNTIHRRPRLGLPMRGRASNEKGDRK